PENRVYVFDREGPAGRPAARSRIIVLRPTRRHVRLEGTSLVAGTYFSRRFDSAAPRTRWHKFALDADIPPNTQVRVSYVVDEQKRDTDARLLDEARPLSEKNAAYGWSQPVVNATDALVGGEGRYLWLRIELIGSETSTPTLRSVRVEFPRASYLRYLPAVYQEDARSRDFLERFLSVFETFFGQMERRLATVARLFDPEAARAGDEFLRWVATWLAVAVDRDWDAERLRKLVRRAPELYRKRGTREGIEEYIEIFTGERPLVVEKFQLECEGMDAEVAKLFGRLFEADPYCFCVLLKPCAVRTDEERRAVARLLDAEKPAHTCAGLLALQPWTYLDMHTYLGVNTYLSEPDLRLDTGAAMPRDTVLADAEDAGQIGPHSRLGVDTTLA
nr:phage tail protein [Acidobacteriota bacterium]